MRPSPIQTLALFIRQYTLAIIITLLGFLIIPYLPSDQQSPAVPPPAPSPILDTRAQLLEGTSIQGETYTAGTTSLLGTDLPALARNITENKWVTEDIVILPWPEGEQQHPQGNCAPHLLNPPKATLICMIRVKNDLITIRVINTEIENSPPSVALDIP